MINKRYALLIAISQLLTGCVAAPMAGMYALSAATTGYFGYAIYKTYSGATASFQIERSDPAPAALTTIRNAKRLAIYPSGGQSDGDDVDIFRASTDMGVVSSSQTIAWVAKNRVPNLDTLPSAERLAVASRLARDNRADLAIMFIAMDPDVKVSFLASAETRIKFATVLVGASGQMLWTEKQEVVIEAGPPHSDSIFSIVI